MQNLAFCRFLHSHMIWFVMRLQNTPMQVYLGCRRSTKIWVHSSMWNQDSVIFSITWEETTKWSKFVPSKVWTMYTILGHAGNQLGFLFMFLLRRNGTPPLFDVLPFEINNENYFLLIGFICTLFYNFPHSSVGWRVG